MIHPIEATNHAFRLGETLSAAAVLLGIYASELGMS